MRKLLLLLSSVALCAIISFTSCRKGPEANVYQDGELNLPSTPYNYFDNGQPEGDRLATLGRVLFYDKHLSKNNAISCASCHIQEHAFGDNKALSQGFANKRTIRNSIAIHNIRNPNSFSLLPITTSLFWDGRTTDIKQMVLEPSLNHIEMGMATTEDILEKVKGLDYYKPLLDQVGITNLKIEDISEALSHFVVSINVQDSKFDKVR